MFCTQWSFAINLFSSVLFKTFKYIWKHLPTMLLISLCCCVGIFYIKFRFSKTFTVKNSVTTILLIKILYKFKTIKCWFTLNLHMYVLGLYKFKCFVYLSSLPCISHSIDVCTVVNKNIRNMHTVSTNQTADILHLNDNT